MNRLISHIERSISIHKCVVVPSLGGFVAELLPACYDRDDNLIYPPKEELRFNAALSLRDGILEDSYARAYGISHRRARVMLDDDVRTLRAELVRAGRVSLEKMGELTLNPEGQISYSHRSEAEDRVFPTVWLLARCLVWLSLSTKHGPLQKGRRRPCRSVGRIIST